jgi:mono/diheme cytochrome c family protein
MKSVVKHVIVTVAALAAVGLAAGAVFVKSGFYNFAADEPHTAMVHSTIETMRERSIQVRAEKIQVPDLTDQARIVKGAGNYQAMCATCHLAPGRDASELSRGLYPAPPNLSKEAVGPANAFWVIKHGVKASGMPAWGKSMGDEDIWNMAAFLQQLPRLDAAAYGQMVANSGGHTHAGGEGHTENGGPMKGEAHAGDHHHGDAAGEEAGHPHGGDGKPDHHGAARADHHHGGKASSEPHGHGPAAAVKQ